ncbi:LysR substrate-binding domain-containing protein [Azospirillum canadense]|uniref:LysR substrate-binding domain-containing protein n=1 Tax=Azospirillum canadense TaxID=403962 RepID=UPI0022266EAA|nr:LysR substrate-binding domain-containing protein [Azospirillum canadense]MCW2241747.1 DNA-binding transcriptional LysR family regulator [Azospirillum canadense]
MFHTAAGIAPTSTVRMARRLPPLLALRAFDIFARQGTVRAAADELAVSHTVVSRHIQNLEQSVGVKLVAKSGRGLSLTREGIRFAAQLRRAFDLIADASNELRNGGMEAVHICCLAGLASRRLLARLPELEEALAGREVILQPTSTRPDFSREEADAEIMYLEDGSVAEGLRSEMFARPRILAIASPEFKARYPDVRSPADLVGLPLIHEQSTGMWEAWLEEAGVADQPRLRGPRLWQAHLTIEAARLGRGVALVSDLLVADPLANGELVEMVDSNVTIGGYYFIAPAQKWNTPVISAIRQWLRAIFPPEATHNV